MPSLTDIPSVTAVSLLSIEGKNLKSNLTNCRTSVMLLKALSLSLLKLVRNNSSVFISNPFLSNLRNAQRSLAVFLLSATFPLEALITTRIMLTFFMTYSASNLSLSSPQTMNLTMSNCLSPSFYAFKVDAFIERRRYFC